MSESLSVLHDIIIEKREKATMTGITDVESYDEETILAKSGCGDITVKGHSLKISRLSVESGDMVIEGEIDSVSYSKGRAEGSFFSRVFR